MKYIPISSGAMRCGKKMCIRKSQKVMFDISLEGKLRDEKKVFCWDNKRTGCTKLNHHNHNDSPASNPHCEIRLTVYLL